MSLEAKKAFEPWREIKYRASDLPVSSRILSHWRDAGLMDVYDDNPDQLKISFIALFWLIVAIELRRFGLSLDTINSIKNRLFETRYFFEGYLVSALMNKDDDVFLIVSVDGRVEIGTRREIDASEALGLLEENYIKLNFKILRNRIFTKNKIELANPLFAKDLTTDTERTVLDFIRDGDYQEVILKFQDGSVSHVTKKALIKNPDPVQGLKEIINSSDGFCDISIKKFKGKIVHFETATMLKT